MTRSRVTRSRVMPELVVTLSNGRLILLQMQTLIIDILALYTQPQITGTESEINDGGLLSLYLLSILVYKYFAPGGMFDEIRWIY